MHTNPYIVSPIVDGQYEVVIYLNEWMSLREIETFSNSYDQLCHEDNDFRQVCFLDNNILKYRSESLFPSSDKINPKKKKVMIILGNPATHSVAQGMFFYSKDNGSRHQFWGKLEKAGLLRKELNKNSYDRQKEAENKISAIINGDTSDQYVIGLTTFYSFPTPVNPRNNKIKKQYPARTKYGDAIGVEKLFKSAISRLQKMEYDRLNSYDFAQNATWILTQLSSYRYMKNISRTEYWPMSSMSNGSGGEDLKNIMEMP